MNERENALKTYFLLARKRITGTRSGFNKQFYAEGLREIWSAFDAYLGWNFPARTEREQRLLFYSKYQKFFGQWKKSNQFKESLLRLVNLSPVRNMKTQKDSFLTNKDDLLQILDFSYVVRSNLSHGAKDLESENTTGVRNRELVEHCFKIDYEILERVLIETNFSI